MKAIVFDQLSLKREKKELLHNFCGHITQGEVVTLLGPNGSGKSTLLKAILGLVKPSKGKIYIYDQEVTKKGNRIIGYLPQTRAIEHCIPISVYERLSISLKGFQWGMPLLNKVEKEYIYSLLEKVGAQSYANKPLSQLSGGEKQRLAFAQALLSNPKLLLLDEPLTALDPLQQENILQLIQKISLDITLIITGHDINPLLPIVNRVLYLGLKQACLGTVAEVMTSEKLTALYGLPIEVIEEKKHFFILYPWINRNRNTG